MRRPSDAARAKLRIEVRPRKFGRGLKPVYDIDVKDALRDINPRPAPPGMATARFREGEPKGMRESKDLAWYRGHHAGVYDAYLTIRKRYPRVAVALIKAFGLNAKGSFSV